MNASTVEHNVVGTVLREYGHGLWPCFFGEHVSSSVGPDGVEGFGYRTCGLHTLQSPCVVYSFGSADDFDFEEDILARTPCEVHIFDPAPAVGGHPLSKSVRRLAIGSVDGEVPMRWWQHSAPEITQTRTLASIMAELGHRHVDVLKVDVEGAEHDALTPLRLPLEARGRAWPSVGQLLMEVHLAPRFAFGVGDWKALVASAEGAGLRLFHLDRPWRYCGSSCLLAAFIQREWAPERRNYA